MKYSFCQACSCDSCQQMTNLKLISFVPYGYFLIKKVNRFEEIAGEDVILAHRLMKNSINSSEYILITDSIAKLNDLNCLGDLDHRTEKCEGLDDVLVSVYYPNSTAYDNNMPQGSWFQRFRSMNSFFKRGNSRKVLEEQYLPQPA